MPSDNALIYSKWKDALTLMRIPFSIFLMPVFWFAMSDPMVIQHINMGKAVLIFIILHVGVYAASNGYNSYCDKDEDSVGGLERPPKTSAELLYLVILFDVLSVLLSLFINFEFAVMMLIYLLVSKAYSYEKIRLKKYPIVSSLVVAFFQGFWIYVAIVQSFNSHLQFNNYTLTCAGVSSCFLLGSYPITQIYQHQSDKKRGDKTLSIVLGLWGTFAFSGLVFFIATSIYVIVNFIYGYYFNIGSYLILTAPILVFLTKWVINARKDVSEINFKNTMQMNKISSLSMSLIFIANMLYGYYNLIIFIQE